MSEPISWTALAFKAPKKPKGLIGEVSRGWDYLVNRGGVCRASEFDDDFAPAGPAIRQQLARFGVESSTSRRDTIIYLPEQDPQ